jgi:hypothetical protein
VYQGSKRNFAQKIAFRLLPLHHRPLYLIPYNVDRSASFYTAKEYPTSSGCTIELQRSIALLFLLLMKVMSHFQPLLAIDNATAAQFIRFNPDNFSRQPT